MTLRPATAGRTVDVRAPADFPTNRGGLCPKGWTAADAARPPGPADAPRWCADPGTGAARCARRPGTRRSTWSPRRSGATQRRYGPDAVGLLRRRRADQREGVPAGQVRPGGAAARAQIDYNGRFCMSSAAAAGDRAFGIDRGLPFPLADLAGADVAAAGRRQPGRDDAAAHAVPRRGPRARRAGTSSSTRGAPPTARAARPAPAAAPRAPTWRWPTACCTSRSGEGCVDDGLRRGPDDRLRRRSGRAVTGYWPDRVERITGVPAADLRRRSRERWATAGVGDGPHRPRAPSSTATGADTAQAFINLALALGLPGRPGSRLRLAHRAGQRAGRPRARAEGRPAARLPPDRRPGRTAHVAGGVGRRPDAAAADRAVRLRAARRAGHRRRRADAAGVRRPTSRSSAPDARPRRGPAAARSTSWWWPTSFLSETAADAPTSCCRSPSGPRRTAR